MLPKVTFVLGGAASGKSLFAEKLLINSGLKLVYIATSQVLDDEMAKRVDVHVARRSSDWQTVNAPLDLAGPLAERQAGEAVLVDCATMWLTNLMMAEQSLEGAGAGFAQALDGCPASVVVVSNEVGQGIVPDNAMARRFREAQGRLNIAIAAQADCVVQVVAGLPNVLKGQLP